MALKITLTKYNSKYFPVKGSWRIGSETYSAVFENVQQAKNYFIGRYMNVSITDKTA